MWMQRSMEGTSINSHGSFHSRNQFSQGGNGSYSGASNGPAPTGTGSGDWKSKILESGQWLGGKVIEYGGRLARGGSHDTIPDQHQPRNDGRANWMADIRNSSSSSSSFANGYNSNAGGGNTYQNDFATERPKPYADYNRSYGPQDQTARYDKGKSERRRAKKKSESMKKNKKKNKKKAKFYSDSESEQESDASMPASSGSEDESESASDSGSDRAVQKAKSKTRRSSKKLSKRRQSLSASESDEELPSASRTSSKSKRSVDTSGDYKYSFDPSNLPPPPAKDSSGKDSSRTSSKSKSSKSKSRGRRQSMESSDSDVHKSDKENNHSKASKRRSKKNGKTKGGMDANVDLLGVDFPTEQPVNSTGNVAATQQSVFDAFDQPVNMNPMQDLAGLNFVASAPAPSSGPPHPANSMAQPCSHGEAQTAEQAQRSQVNSKVLQNLLPENSIVDFDTLASEKKKVASGDAGEKRTLNDLQKAKQGERQPTPVMPTYPSMSHQQAMMPHPMASSNMAAMHPMQMQQMQVQMQQMQLNQMPQYPMQPGMATHPMMAQGAPPQAYGYGNPQTQGQTANMGF